MNAGLTSAKHTKNYGKSPFLMGKSTISIGPFSIAMLCYVSLPEGRMYIGFSQQQVGFKLPIEMASGELLHSYGSYGQLWYRWPINIHKL